MTVKILIGDVRERLRDLPEESVHCVVTSPPYWGLRCYGVDGQIGQEPTLGEHVEVMVEVFREVRRVLRKDGTVWLNYGDAYAANRGYQVPDSKHRDVGNAAPMSVPDGLKPKDLCMMPARVALALQADGWWLRSEIIWHKPNPLPESVTDRPTQSHEKIFLLARNERYYFDAEAVREADLGTDHARNVLHKPEPSGGILRPHTGIRRPDGRAGAGRNMRNVWTIPTANFPGAHSATFPPALIEPCIKAGTSEKGCCPKCGTPWVRVTKHIAGDTEASERPERTRGMQDSTSTFSLSGQGSKEWERRGSKTLTTGWRPSCGCSPPLASVPCTVLDIFGGAGTTGLVAARLNRNAVLIELNPEYAAMARARIQADGGMFAEVS